MTIRQGLPSGGLTRRTALAKVLALAGAGLVTAFARPAHAQFPSLIPLSNPNVSTDPARIYLLRGLFGIFSLGMDSLAAKLQARGYNPNILSWTDASVVVDQISVARRGGDDKPIILIGHSLGSNAVVGIAQQLGQQNIPVDLVVTFDATEALRASSNVKTFINFFQNNGFGRPIAPGPGFTGELQNIDLSADKSISHGNIDEAAALQQVVTDRVFALTNRQMQAAATQQRNRVRR